MSKKSTALVKSHPAPAARQPAIVQRVLDLQAELERSAENVIITPLLLGKALLDLKAEVQAANIDWTEYFAEKLNRPRMGLRQSQKYMEMTMAFMEKYPAISLDQDALQVKGQRDELVKTLTECMPNTQQHTLGAMRCALGLDKPGPKPGGTPRLSAGDQERQEKAITDLRQMHATKTLEEVTEMLSQICIIRKTYMHIPPDVASACVLKIKDCLRILSTIR